MNKALARPCPKIVQMKKLVKAMEKTIAADFEGRIFAAPVRLRCLKAAIKQNIERLRSYREELALLQQIEK